MHFNLFLYIFIILIKLSRYYKEYTFFLIIILSIQYLPFIVSGIKELGTGITS